MARLPSPRIWRPAAHISDPTLRATDPLQALTSAQNSYPVRIEMPADAPAELLRPGTLAQATVFTDEGNPINVLAKILMWISAWTNYVF